MTTVRWEQPARDDLDAVWAAADAAELPALEQLILDLLADLRADPLAVGESRDAPRRVVVRAPLTVWFDVRNDAQQVRIFAVRRPTRRG